MSFTFEDWLRSINLSPGKLLRDLKVAVTNVLDIFATIDPSKIIAKIKYHLLVHTDEDVIQFSLLVGVATEIFESFNGVIRYCSILSSHLAPSRDIALQLGDQEGLKHRITGGFWPSGVDGKWERAGSGVRSFTPVALKRVYNFALLISEFGGQFPFWATTTLAGKREFQEYSLPGP
ncbi:hypothetical protein B0H13DRAFT_1852482 [Mycena leptocephala]|nr:hypothetical protein B0H13DRAFT_1852482 [Mycena leptocephala]